MFGVENAIRMLEYKIDNEHWPVLKTCLIYLNYIDDTWKVEIPLDQKLITRMRDL